MELQVISCHFWHYTTVKILLADWGRLGMTKLWLYNLKAKVFIYIKYFFSVQGIKPPWEHIKTKSLLLILWSYGAKTLKKIILYAYVYVCIMLILPKIYMKYKVIIEAWMYVYLFLHAHLCVFIITKGEDILCPAYISWYDLHYVALLSNLI